MVTNAKGVGLKTLCRVDLDLLVYFPKLLFVVIDRVNQSAF